MPNRNGNGLIVRQHDLPILEDEQLMILNQHNNNQYQPQQHQFQEPRDPSITKCCVPTGCHVDETIHMDDLSDSTKVICNNEHCTEGHYMHKECFEQWEESVLNFLRSTGRARSWSEKQRLQNLWTKKGYDLAYKACGCKCGKGHLRKDLDWIPPPASKKEDTSKKKKSRRKKNNERPNLIISSATNIVGANKHPHTPMNQSPGSAIPVSRLRTSSMSSTGSGGSGGTSPPILESTSPSLVEHASSMRKFLFGDPTRRDRHGSGSIFSRRQDYSSFNTLPRHKINSYHIKMEDDGNHGNDETRCFILSTLSASKTNR